MSVIRCVQTAAAVQRLHQQDRKYMERLWAREFAAGQATLGAGGAERQANQAVHNAMTGLAAHMRVVAQLQKEALDRVMADAARFRNRKGQVDIGEFALQLVNRVHFRAQALFRLDLSEMGSMLHEFRKKARSGFRHNRARMDLVVREVFGENTGDATAKALAQMWIAMVNRKIAQFNAVGGNIVTRLDWHFPQVHDAIAIARAGIAEWKAYIRGRLDQTKMTNPRTGQAFTPTEFEEMLDEAFVSIKYQTNAAEPTMSGQYGTAAWRRHADPRFFVFKDADAWMEYSKRFGAGSNPFEVMMGYLRSINHDLAGMQMLGPHANGTMRYMVGDNDSLGGQVQYHAQLAEEGDPRSLFAPTNDQGAAFKGEGRVQYAKDKAIGAQRAWAYFTGEARRPFNKGWAAAEATITNLKYANMLAFTPTLVGGDIINQAATRAFRGVSVTGMMRDLVDAFRLSTDRATLAELGVEIDVGISAIASEARDHASVNGHPLAQWMTDRALTFTGLKPMTMGLRAMWTMGVLHDVTRHMGTAFDRLPRPFRDMLERYDIDRSAWAIIQAAPTRNRKGVNVVTPSDIAGVGSFSIGVQARAGLSAGEEVAVRLLTLIQEEGESATISGTPRSARILPFRPGSISGSVLGSVSRLKTYSISHFQHHGFRAAEIFWRNGGGLRGLPPAAGYYMAGLILPSMVLVAAGQVIAEMLKGREAPDVTDPAFVNGVFWRTVSLGFYQDFVRGATDADNPFSQGAQLSGPIVGTYVDVVTLGAYGLSELDNTFGEGEDDTQTGRQALRTIKGFVPRHWATDTAMERLVWDNMQRMVDPEAEADFRRRARRVEQGSWWAPGEEGMPWEQDQIDLRTLDLEDRDGDYAQ